MYSDDESVANPVPFTVRLTALFVTVGVAGEMLVIVSGAAPGMLKFAVPIAWPVRGNASGLPVPLKSCVHPAKSRPVAPGFAVKFTVPAVKKASTSPFAPIELVPVGVEVTFNRLLPEPSRQYNEGSTIVRKLGV